MATITEPMALDASFNTTETNPRNIADVLAEMGEAIAQGMGRQANEVSYDNTTSGLSADDVQEAIDELADEKVDKVNGKGLSTNDYTDAEKTKLAGIEQGAEVNVQSDWAQTDSSADDFIKNKQLVTEPIEELQNDVQSTQTATGNPLTLTDCAPINAESLVVELEPKQDLHGYDFPWVGGSGKNKLPLDLATIKSLNTSGTWSGNSYTYNNVTFTVQTDNSGNIIGIDVLSNNAIAVTNLYLVRNFAIQDGSYIVNGCPQGSVGNNYMIAVDDIGDDTGQGVNVNVSGNSLSIRIRVATSATFSTVRFKPMLRLATESDSTFAPYSNICPITGYTQTSVEGCGKNLFNPEWFTATGITVSENIVSGTASAFEVAFGTYAKRIQLKCEQNELYTVSFKAYTDGSVSTSGGGLQVYACYADGTETIKNNIANSITTISSFNFTSDSGKTLNGIKISYGSGGGNTWYISEFQLEKSSTPTTYEPYHSSNATIQFGQTVYGADVDFGGGGTKDKFKKVSLSSLSWSQSVDAKGRRYSSALSDIYDYTDFQSVPHLVCDSYKVVSGYDLYTDTDLIGITTNQDKRIYIRTPDGEPPSSGELCYEIATYDDISTPATPLKLIKGTNNLSADGVMQIGYQKDNVIGEVKGEIEQHLEMPWLQVIIEGEQDDFDEVLLEDGGNIIQFPLADNEIYKHRFLLFEVYTTLLGLPMSLCGNAMLSTQTLIEFEHGAYIPLSIGNLTDGITARVYVGITADNEVQVQLESTASSPLTNIYIRARLVD